jgi:hypothetical protein
MRQQIVLIAVLIALSILAWEWTEFLGFTR